MTGGVQNFAGIANVLTRFGPVNLLSIDHNKTITWVSFIFDWDD